MSEPCTLTYLGHGECQECRLSFKPKMGQELRLQHTNDEGTHCSLHCKICRSENPSTDFSEDDGW